MGGAQWVRTFTPQAEGWVFESQPRQTQVVKTGSDSSTAKRSALGVSVTGPRRLPLPLKMQHTINDDQFFVCTETALNMQRMAIIENLITLKKYIF